MPIFSATKPINGNITPTTPQLKPPIKPDIMLLYCGIVFCAMTIFIDTDNIVTKPVKTYIIKEINDDSLLLSLKFGLLKVDRFFNLLNFYRVLFKIVLLLFELISSRI